MYPCDTRPAELTVKTLSCLCASHVHQVYRTDGSLGTVYGSIDDVFYRPRYQLASISLPYDCKVMGLHFFTTQLYFYLCWWWGYLEAKHGNTPQVWILFCRCITDRYFHVLFFQWWWQVPQSLKDGGYKRSCPALHCLLRITVKVINCLLNFLDIFNNRHQKYKKIVWISTFQS